MGDLARAITEDEEVEVLGDQALAAGGRRRLRRGLIRRPGRIPACDRVEGAGLALDSDRGEWPQLRAALAAWLSEASGERISFDDFASAVVRAVANPEKRPGDGGVVRVRV